MQLRKQLENPELILIEIRLCPGIERYKFSFLKINLTKSAWSLLSSWRWCSRIFSCSWDSTGRTTSSGNSNSSWGPVCCIVCTICVTTSCCLFKSATSAFSSVNNVMINFSDAVRKITDSWMQGTSFKYQKAIQFSYKINNVFVDTKELMKLKDKHGIISLFSYSQKSWKLISCHTAVIF